MKRLSPEALAEQFAPDFFRSASTFGALSDDAIHWLLNEGKLYALDSDELLFDMNERGDSFFVILSGTIAYYKVHEGRSAFIRDYLVGEQIGFMSMIALHHRVGSAIARTPSVVLEVDTELFHRLHETAPSDFGLLMMNLAREMARALRKADNLVVTYSNQQNNTTP